MLNVIIIVLTGCNNWPNQSINHNVSAFNISKTDSSVVSNLIQQSDCFYNKNINNPKVYDDYISQAEEIAVKNNLLTQLAEIYNTLGIRYRTRSEYNKALKLHNKSVKIARDLNNKALLTRYINMLAVVYRRIDENKHALDLHMEALKLAEEVQDTFQISVAYNGLGNIYSNLKRYYASIEYFKKSLEIAKKYNNKLGLAINYNNIGECLKSLNNLDSALVCFNKSLDYNNEINSSEGKAISYNSLGDLYKTQKKYHIALEYLQQALAFNKESHDRINISSSYSIIGETYLLIKNYPQSIKNLNAGLQIAKEIGSKYQIEICNRLLSKVYEALQENKKALNYLKTAETYKDSIINEENLRHLVTVESIQNLEQTKSQIRLLNNKNELQDKLIAIQKKTLFSSLILVIVIISIAILSFRQIKLRSKYNNILMQQRLLRTQMNPHFIFNALSAIQVYILENDMEKSSTFLTGFASLMRQVLRSSEYEYIPLKDETKMLSYYLDLQRLRFVHPFSYHIYVEDNINEDDILIAPMITQPFVENAIEHGIKGLGENGKIDIRFSKKNNSLKIEIEDNGIGWKTSQKASTIGSKHESMAIKITNERLDVIKKMTGKKAFLTIIDKQVHNPGHSGVLVKLELPVLSIKEKNKEDNIQLP